MCRVTRSSATLLACLAACGGSAADPGAAGRAPVAWQSCPATTTGQGGGAECATLSVPLDWAEPAGPMIDIFVKRVRAARPARGQLWLLAGGPGNTGAVYDPVLPALARALPDLDLYIPDHRGVGRSTSLGCAELDPACFTSAAASWGARLTSFSVTQAARDLAHAIARTTGDPPLPVFVYGESYGTFLLNRYLELHPDQPAAAVFDSVCAPSGCPMDSSANHQALARSIMAACGRDPLCSSRLGSDPWSRIADLHAALAGGHCGELAAAGLDAGALRRVFARLVESAQVRALIAPITYRFLRCGPADVAAMRHFAELYRKVGAPGDPAIAWDATHLSRLLAVNVALSEFWDPSLTREAAARFEESALVSDGFTLEMAELEAGWQLPRYPSEPALERWARTSVPVLLVNGTMDPQTPSDRMASAADAFSGPHQRVVLLEGAAHNALATDCGFALVTAFLSDPTAPVDAACAAGPAALDFAGTPELAEAVFGTSHLWDP